MTIPLSDSLRQPCAGAAIPPAFGSVGEVGAFAVRSEAAVQVCDAKRQGLVDLIDAFNAMQRR